MVVVMSATKMRFLPDGRNIIHKTCRIQGDDLFIVERLTAAIKCLEAGA